MDIKFNLFVCSFPSCLFLAFCYLVRGGQRLAAGSECITDNDQSGRGGISRSYQEED